ncbi:MAG: hypothetical protein BRD48_05435 [Bacteroidetes bacterium QS_9_68_14]|nr:MAG: hypothetical protein BRD48_05435 [Bacteroidetes bacterium QS_9_68_14]
MNTYFLVYLIGYGLMIVAVWLGLDAAGVSQTWKLVAAAFLLGLGMWRRPAAGRGGLSTAARQPAARRSTAARQRGHAGQRSAARGFLTKLTPRRGQR